MNDCDCFGTTFWTFSAFSAFSARLFFVRFDGRSVGDFSVALRFDTSGDGDGPGDEPAAAPATSIDTTVGAAIVVPNDVPLTLLGERERAGGQIRVGVLGWVLNSTAWP